MSGNARAAVSIAKLEFEYNRIYYALSGRADSRRDTIRIVYYNERDPRFNRALPEWGGGGALGMDTIIIPNQFKPFLQLNQQQTLIHELVHIAINRMVPPGTIPRWFHEGVAMTMSGEFSPQEQLSVSRAIISGHLPQLASIDSVNLFSKGRADVGYSQSHLALLFIIERFGMVAVPGLLAATQRSGSFDTALIQILNLTTVEFEKIYREYLNNRYKYFFVIADWATAWIGIALLAIIAAVVARVRYLRRKKAMDPLPTTEPPLQNETDVQNRNP